MNTREIKFRSWNKGAQTMAENPTSHGFLNDNFDSDGTIYLQYTGLKDKNGKEIYEGDIFHIGDEKIKYIIEWHDTGLKGRQYNNKSFVGIEHWHLEMEIIGNIHSNPELVK